MVPWEIQGDDFYLDAASAFAAASALGSAPLREDGSSHVRCLRRLAASSA